MPLTNLRIPLASRTRNRITPPFPIFSRRGRHREKLAERYHVPQIQKGRDGKNQILHPSDDGFDLRERRTPREHFKDISRSKKTNTHITINNNSPPNLASNHQIRTLSPRSHPISFPKSPRGTQEAVPNSSHPQAYGPLAGRSSKIPIINPTPRLRRRGEGEGGRSYVITQSK